MIVRCKALEPTKEQMLLLGSFYERGRTDYALVLGKTYLVLGLFVSPGGLIWVDIPADGGWPQTVPLFVFEVVDSKVSRYWDVFYSSEGSLSLEPAPFHESTFASRVADNQPEAELVYKQYCELLEMEARGSRN